MTASHSLLHMAGTKGQEKEEEPTPICRHSAQNAGAASVTEVPERMAQIQTFLPQGAALVGERAR